MTPVDYFKLQAKNLFKDYKTQTSYIDKVDGHSYYTYAPKYFDIERIFLEYEWEEENFTLMKAQHLFALMIGFEKWADILKASDAELELAKLLWDNQHKIHLEDWDMYISDVEFDNNTTFDAESRVEIFKQVFVNVDGHHSPFGDYRIDKNTAHATKSESPRPAPKADPGPQITSLPLAKVDHVEFVKTANSVFESVIERIEPNNPEQTRKLWNAEDYVNNFLTEDMLPISKGYALSLIDAFLVQHVIGLAVQADKAA